MDAVLDSDFAGGADGDPAGALRRGRGGWRQRTTPVRACYLPVACQPVSHLYAALDDLHARRLQYGLLRLRRRAGAVDACAGDAWHPQRLRGRSARARRGGGDVGPAADDPVDHHPDAQAAHDGGAAVSAELACRRPARHRRHYRLRRNLTEAAALGLGVVIVIWTLTPIYNMVAVAEAFGIPVEIVS